MVSNARDLVRGSVTLYSLPTVYLRLTEVVRHPRSSANDIAQVVAEDPGLTARLLRLVNSAFFGFPSKIETVPRAVTIVGTGPLSDLALATSVIGIFDKIPPDLVDMNSFWRHSLGCGVIAKELAHLRHEGQVERIFVAGLLHDVGSLILYLRKADQVREVLGRCREREELVHRQESEVFGFDHAELGRELLQAWHLPPSLQEPVGYHHDPLRAPRFPLEASFVHVADLIANALEFGSSGERLVPALDPGAWDLLGVSPDQLSGVIEESERQLAEVCQTLLGKDPR